MLHDLGAAGAAQQDLESLINGQDPDIAGRFGRIRPAWEACQFTGYGEALRLAARETFGIEEISAQSLAQANDQLFTRDRRGERLRLLRDVAGLDHIQVDDESWSTGPDPSGPDFFFYDLSWREFSLGIVNAQTIEERTGIAVRDVCSLRQAMEKIFEIRAPYALAIKSQHAYWRTLAWSERSDAEADAALQKTLRGQELAEAETICLGDWGLARGVELATVHGLPVKIHTGYLAGFNQMRIDDVRVGQLCPLLLKYPAARFDLFHIAYGHQQELIALAKHFSNVYVDMCWAWGIDPLSAGDFLRRMIHAAPCNKLFVFGGDSRYPCNSVAFARLARRGLTRALEAEVREGWLREPEAMALARRFMIENQKDFFKVDALRESFGQALSQPAAG